MHYLKNKTYFTITFLTIIFILFSFFRFYNLDKRVTFDWDQESFSKEVRNLIINNDIILIGPRVTDDKGFFLGPYFTYLLVPFYLISNTHPNAFLPFLVVINILFFVGSFITLKKIFNTYTALVFLFLWSTNPSHIKSEITVWNPLLISLGVIVTWQLLLRIYNNPSLKNYILLGLSCGFFTHMHFQFMFVNVFTIIFLLALYLQDRKEAPIKYTAAFMIAALSTLAPLFLFDLRHNFLNTHLFITYFTERIGGQNPDINVWHEIFDNFLYTHLFTHNLILISVFALSVVIATIILYRKRNHFLKLFYVSTICIWIFTYIGFSVYGRTPSEYYFNYLFPFIYVVLIDFFNLINKRYIPVALGIVLFILNWTELQKTIAEYNFSLYYKDQAVQKILPYIKDKKFNVSFDMPLGTNNGYQYLLDVHNIKSSGDMNDPLIQLRVPPNEGDIQVKEIGVYIPPELKK